jgi:hypothetical protein
MILELEFGKSETDTETVLMQCKYAIGPIGNRPNRRARAEWAALKHEPNPILYLLGAILNLIMIYTCSGRALKVMKAYLIYSRSIYPPTLDLL